MNENEFVTVRLYAAARAAVGRSEFRCKPSSAQEMLNDIAAGDVNILSLFSRCSILVQGEQLHDREKELPSGSDMDFPPPFAGGSH